MDTTPLSGTANSRLILETIQIVTFATPDSMMSSKTNTAPKAGHQGQQGKSAKERAKQRQWWKTHGKQLRKAKKAKLKQEKEEAIAREEEEKAKKEEEIRGKGTT